MDEDRRAGAIRSSGARCARAARGLAAAWMLAAATACGDGAGDGGQADVTDRRTDARLAASATTTLVCSGGARSVVLLVDPTLAAGIRARLDRFEQDLCLDGYTALEHPASFVTPADVRAYLAGTARARTLAGTFLIGSVPYAYQLVTSVSSNPSIPSFSEEIISFQYYTDLDGTFTKSAGYASPGRRTWSYDQHGGNMESEQWVGVLPLYKGDRAQTIAALNRYFDKNHAYRTGGAKPPRRFLEVNEHFASASASDDAFYLGTMRDGDYAWKPFSNAAGAQLYFDSKTAALSLDAGYAALVAGQADFAVQDAHGYWGKSGRLSIAWAESTPIRTIFYWSNGCAVGNLEHADNFLASVLYSPTSDVLVARGSTNDSGGMGNNTNGFFGKNIATRMSQGGSFGDALLYHMNTPLIAPWSASREFQLAPSITLGDPTLRLR